MENPSVIDNFHWFSHERHIKIVDFQLHPITMLDSRGRVSPPQGDQMSVPWTETSPEAVWLPDVASHGSPGVAIPTAIEMIQWSQKRRETPCKTKAMESQKHRSILLSLKMLIIVDLWSNLVPHPFAALTEPPCVLLDQRWSAWNSLPLGVKGWIIINKAGNQSEWGCYDSTTNQNVTYIL